MCLDDDYLGIVKKLNYIPVGLKNKIFRRMVARQYFRKYIREESYYGEYTFYYWYEKSLKHKKDEWVGFCSYRELWGEHKDLKNRHSITSLLKKMPSEWSKYEAIGEPTTLNRPNG